MRSSVRLLLALTSGLVALCLAEAGFRVTRYLVRGPDSAMTVDDRELGWVHNTRHPPIARKNSCGEDVLTPPPPSPYIVRQPHERRGIRVLFLGDSSTHAHEVSAGEAYYDVVEQAGRGQFSVWAAGVGGYGNYQESLLLEKVYGDVTPDIPDIVVWQLDDNDVSNNVYQLDYGVLNNNIQPRPYLDPSTGRVEMRSPALPLFRVSQGARFLLSRAVGLDRRFDMGLVDRVESWLGPGPADVPALERQGLQVLDRVVGDAVTRHPGTRFIGFSVSDDRDQDYSAIFMRHGAGYWPAIGSRVRASGLRTDCAPLDTHWNRTGNRVAGQILAALLAAP